jgi:hypothetical protein
VPRQPRRNDPLVPWRCPTRLPTRP